MKRRDSIRAILVGTVASSVLVDACKSADEKANATPEKAAGPTGLQGFPRRSRYCFLSPARWQ